MPRVAQRDRRGASDEVVCVLADAFGFESADDYGRANEATLSRLRAQARRARALAKVNAFVSRHGLTFSPPISPPTISEQQVLNPFWLRRRRRLLQRAFWLGSCALKDAAASKRNGDGAFFLNGR